MTALMSEIRELLAAAQSAEGSGDLLTAIRHLTNAAEWYRSRALDPRAAQMERQVERLKARLSERGAEDDGFGFGDGFAADARGLEVRTARLDDGTSNWCSFCCRPATEVGRLVAGPAGSYICAACVVHGGVLLGQSTVPVARMADAPVLTSTQQRAAERLRVARCGVLFGPSGSGKSTVISRLCGASVLVLDAATAADGARAQAFLSAGAERRVVLAVSAEAPPPAFVLQGPEGAALVHTSSSLRPHVGDAAPLIDVVVSLTAPGPDDLLALARAWLEAKGALVPDGVVERLVEVAMGGGGLTELVALVARIPSGSWQQ